MDGCGGDGDNFKLYGIIFDLDLRMEVMIESLSGKLKGKLHNLHKLSPYYNSFQMFNMFKSQIWSSVEWCTPGIFHALPTLLVRIDSI